MPIGVGVAAIVAAVVAAGGSIVSGALNNASTESASAEARRLAMIKRQDELNVAEENKKLSKEYLRLEKKQMAFNRESELFGREERGVERGVAARQNAFTNSLNLVNGSEALRANFLNMWKRG